ILPYRFSDIADHIRTYMQQIIDQSNSMRKETEFAQKLHQKNAYVLAADPTKTYHAPQIQEKVPHLNFAPLQNAVDHLKEAAHAYNQAFSRQMEQGVTLSQSQLRTVNKLLQSSEQQLTDEGGLPRRPWFKHQIYAPGFYTGYGVKTLPGVREAVEQRNWQEVSQEMLTTADAINRYANHIEKITDVMK